MARVHWTYVYDDRGRFIGTALINNLAPKLHMIEIVPTVVKEGIEIQIIK